NFQSRLMSDIFNIVQLTDLHIRRPGQLAYGKVNTTTYLQTAVRSVLQLKQRPAAVMVTGDLTDFGRPEEYTSLRHLLAPLDMPVYLMAGNHDNRDNLRAAFKDHTYLGTHGFV